MDAKVPDFLDGLFSSSPKNEQVASPAGKTSKKRKKKTSADAFIADVFNNFEPLHGHGSGEKALDEMKKTQAEILAKRKSLDVLKKKYRDSELDHHGEIPMIAFDPKDLNQKEDDAMYLDENSVEVPSFHIEEAADSLIEKMSNWVNQKTQKDLTP